MTPSRRARPASPRATKPLHGWQHIIARGQLEPAAATRQADAETTRRRYPEEHGWLPVPAPPETRLALPANRQTNAGRGVSQTPISHLRLGRHDVT